MKNALILSPVIYIKEPDGFNLDRRIRLADEAPKVLTAWLRELGYKVYSQDSNFDCSLEIPDDWNGRII